ncbi:S8 family peptidase [Rhizobium laguerreae]|uniref:Subtilase family protein n=1 Tax=Rhizobium laguerreae TaxID=1076926 RepID=A0AAX2QCD6_9HYPH|nr:S8 family serine peptidase [Rhizobium laguerreae]MBY3265313.1 S8 family serine peptidase [Rhizobium laguerreae]MBY3337754.1 S8 family serine peptidase [Rhizobium laguerreae]TCU13902.1 subtilase family protein [Rhizobium laguerreae]
MIALRLSGAFVIISATAQLIAPGIASAQDALSKATTLPSQATNDLIRSLPEVGAKVWASEKPLFRDLVVDQNNLNAAGQQKLEMNDGQQKTVPFVLPNSMIIQFDSDVTPAQVDDYLKSNNLPVIQKFENIGAVQVITDISKYFHSEITDKSANESILRGMNQAIDSFKKDPRVLSATPDLFLSDKTAHEDELDVRNMIEPTEIITGASGAALASTIDWGVKDIEADKLWSMPGANDGIIFGVMDVGFSRHEDLSFLGFPTDTHADNHGNHVAGIACGLHNSKGIEGVLPNCFVRARSGDVFFQSGAQTPELRFVVLFSQILATLNNFVGGEDDVSTYNVSLGYNWRSNFGINPDLPESSAWRSLVESQGVILVSILEAANKDGKVIFSAAGNDSKKGETPISSKYASPFNWAALAARDKGIENGVIVAAHDAAGKRANFSNVDADISCPGVDVMSSLAFDGQSSPSNSSYGKMSGTSMASPYCASAHVLFGLIRPGYTGVEAVKCMVSSGVPGDAAAPMLKLTMALAKCPPKS